MKRKYNATEKWILFWIWIGIFVFLFHILLPYGKVEYYTKICDPDLPLDTTDTYAYYKVLDYYKEGYAKIYYVYGHGNGGYILEYVLVEGEWREQFGSIRRIWPFLSEDGYIWPYYW